MRVVDLLGTPFLLSLIVVTVAVLASVAWWWNRWPGGLRILGRGLSLVLVMVMGAAMAGDLVNRSFGFYSSFSDIFGGSPTAYQAPSAFASGKAAGRITVRDREWELKGLRQARTGRGILLDVTYGGARSGISRAGLLYLPAAYFVRGSTARFPAVEMFHGAPGRPANYANQVGIGGILDAEIAAGRIPPVIAVIPTIYQGGFSDCVDAVHGQRDETYLAIDVPDDVASAFRVLPGRSYALVGYSTGGFCAVNLGLHHPDRYAAVASLSGFFTAGEDPGTAHLYGRSIAARNRNSPLWWISHRSPTVPPIYLATGAEDVSAVREERALVAAIKKHTPQLPYYAAEIPGAHSWRVWAAAMPAALDWICGYLPADLAPGLQLPKLH